MGERPNCRSRDSILFFLGIYPTRVRVFLAAEIKRRRSNGA